MAVGERSSRQSRKKSNMTVAIEGRPSPAIIRMLKAYGKSECVEVVEMPEVNDLLTRLLAYKDADAALYKSSAGHSRIGIDERARQREMIGKSRVKVVLRYSYVELGELAVDGTSIDVKASEEQRDVFLAPESLTVSGADDWVFVGCESGSSTDCMSSRSWRTTYTFTMRSGDLIKVEIT